MLNLYPFFRNQLISNILYPHLMVLFVNHVKY
nr:MAG TPA: hypothetical protein [Caudoviricetes sp.]